LTNADILGAINASASPDTVLAIDAPLIIKNQSGQRQCERLIGQRFGHADASAHTSNLTLFPSARSVAIAAALERSGWSHAVEPATDRRRPGKWFFEVYPHPGHVVLFDRKKIVKYKKGKVRERCAGLQELRHLIRDQLGCGTPRLIASSSLTILLEQTLDVMGPSDRKQYEDSLDAVLCGYLAAHYWAWGSERNEMIGTMASGYIVVPSRTTAGDAWRFARQR
jgi:predicted RNase H-like nuclease